MSVVVVSVTVGVTLIFFIGMQMCGRCYMRPRYINLDEYDEIV